MQGDAIKAKFTPGGPLRKHASRFEARIKELSAQVVAPAVKSWVTEEFPEVDAVRAVYPDPARSMAALQVLEGKLIEKVGRPPLPATTAKVERDHAALMKLNPKSDDGYPARLDACDALRRSLAFQAEVLNRFFPIYAVDVENQLGKEQFETRKKSDEERIWRAYKGVGLAVLAVPVVFLLIGRRPRRRSASRPPDDTDPFRLPEALARIRVFLKSYRLDFNAGQVIGKDSSTETITTHYHTPGDTYRIGDTVYRHPGTWRSSTSTTTYYHYRLRTPDGRDLSYRFRSYPSDIEEGHLMSTVTSGNEILYYCNHTTGMPISDSTTLDTLHRLPGRWMWLTSVALAYLGLDAVQRYVVKGSEHEVDYRFGYRVASLTLLTALVSPIYLGIIKSLVQKRRHRQFQDRYASGLKRFIEERTPLLENHFQRPGRGRATKG